jgi:hypothetical protein
VVVAAIAIPLYYYRHRIVGRFEGRSQAKPATAKEEKGPSGGHDRA